DPSKPYRYEKENLEVYRAMEEAYREGKIRSLGVSNFNVHDMENIIAHASVPLMVNQIPCYIGNVNEEVIGFAKRNGILIEGYSPLATGQLVHHPDVQKIAEKYGATIPQICIRFVYQLGALPLPKTTHKEFMESNAKIDFEISLEDMASLRSISFKRVPTK
ncbi:MAG: aldo/keto reductase family protein, partial [Candidatus Enteromonas sp.]